MNKYLRAGAMLLCIFALAACGGVKGTPDALKPKAKTNNIAEANLRLGIAYLRRGEYEEALEKLNVAKEADKNYPPVYNMLGVLYQRLGENRDAEQFFRRALRLDGSDHSILNNYGQFLCQQGRYDEAETLFLKALDNPLYETPEIALSNAGTCSMKNGEINKAVDYFRRALERKPTLSTALIQMAQISFSQARHLPARGYLQRYSEVAPHTASSLWLGIRIERVLGDKGALASYALLLKNQFPDSMETHLLMESESSSYER